MIKTIALSALLAFAAAKPAADAEADPQLLAAAPYAVAPAVVPASNCKTEVEILVTQTCTPTAENVCTTQTVETEEIEYEKICKDVVDVLCDAPAAGYIVKREAEAEADAEADPQYLLGGYAAAPVAAPVVAHAAPVVAPVAHAVAHSVKATVKHACREVTTQHCVDNPKIKLVPVEVEHCHTVTKVKCADVNNEIPTTKCEPVVSEHVSHAAYAAPAPYVYGK